MTLVAAASILSLTGFSLSWSSTPAETDSTGSAEVILLIEEGDLLAVTSEDGLFISYEITATVDGSDFNRRGGREVNSSFPISEVLEYSSLEPGGHIVSVSMTDLESGSVVHLEEEITVDLLGESTWSSGALRITPEGPVRANGNINLLWNVYVSERDEIPRAAYAILDSSTEIVREGWFESEQSTEGVIAYSANPVLTGLSRGRYRITSAVMEGDSVAAAAGSSISVLDAWDVWGDESDVTVTLIRPIATAHEVRELERAGGLGDRNSVMADFWNLRDPYPASRGNEYLEIYLLRLDYVSRHFSTLGIRGINTDMGIVYAKMGEPDIIADFPFELNSYPYVTWEYFTPSLNLTFVDHGGYGYYELVEQWETVDRAFNAREEWSQ